MTGTDRLEIEQQFHDLQADNRAQSFRAGDASLIFSDDAYLDHETWIRPAWSLMGDVRGKAILDYGCGHGMAAVVLARQGARVSAFDLSPGYVRETSQRAEANGVVVRTMIADAEALPFPDRSFDAVWGNAILHHLDLDRAGAELRRIVKPGGRAIFCEPWGGNPILEFARRWVPYPGKARTPDEKPLRAKSLQPLRIHFPGLTYRGYQFLGMIRRVAGDSPFTRLAMAADRRLLRPNSLLENWCRYIVLQLPCD